MTEYEEARTIIVNAVLYGPGSRNRYDMEDAIDRIVQTAVDKAVAAISQSLKADDL